MKAGLNPAFFHYWAIQSFQNLGSFSIEYPDVKFRGSFRIKIFHLVLLVSSKNTRHTSNKKFVNSPLLILKNKK
jgi:hypothetical protein